MSEDLKDEIYIYIAEYSWFAFEDSLATDYMGWCNHIKNVLSAGNYSSVKKTVDILSENINVILGTDISEVRKVVMEFFVFEFYKDKYEIIRLSRKLYGGYVVRHTFNKRKKIKYY